MYASVKIDKSLNTIVYKHALWVKIYVFRTKESFGDGRNYLGRIQDDLQDDCQDDTRGWSYQSDAVRSVNLLTDNCKSFAVACKLFAVACKLFTNHMQRTKKSLKKSADF